MKIVRDYIKLEMDRELFFIFLFFILFFFKFGPILQKSWWLIILLCLVEPPCLFGAGVKDLWEDNFIDFL